MIGSRWSRSIGGRNLNFGRAQIYALVLLVMGAASSAFGAWCRERMHRAASWPTTPGRVLESHVQTSRGSKGRTKYRCKVRYEFSAGGRAVQGDALDPLEMSVSQSEAEADCARYPAGGACTVHYDAADPRNSCLQIGDPPMAVSVFLILGGAMLLGSAFCAFRAVT